MNRRYFMGIIITLPACGGLVQVCSNAYGMGQVYGQPGLYYGCSGDKTMTTL